MYVRNPGETLSINSAKSSTIYPKVASAMAKVTFICPTDGLTWVSKQDYSLTFSSHHSSNWEFLDWIKNNLYYETSSLLQVILSEINCAIFCTNLHELFCQFISWTYWVNSGKFMDNCWILCQVKADMKKGYDDLIIINLYSVFLWVSWYIDLWPKILLFRTQTACFERSATI